MILLKSKKNNLINIYISNNFKIIKKKKKFIIFDYNIFYTFFEIIKKYLNNFYFIILPYGENTKNLNVLKIIWKYMIINNINKSFLICGIGGGVIGDVVGYISNSYFRGLNYVLIPSSLLAQVDSSIGGKNAVNFFSKNTIGSIYFPIFILINNLIIFYMKKKEFKDGYSEIIKYSLINSKKLFFYLFKKKKYEKIIFYCCYIKLKIITQDHKETNIRSILNFGHTYAHCIENNKILDFSHGKSVVIGSIFALFLSSLFYIYNNIEIKKILFLFKLYNFSIKNNLNFSINMIKKIVLDKKFNNKINFIIMKKIGSCNKKILKKKVFLNLIKKFNEIR